MKIYLKDNVLDMALKRIEYIFDEFDEVCVCMSGGKDSTVCYNLALAVAKKKNRLPLNVMFIDQEVEWEHTIKYVRKIMYNKDVKPYWFQMPIRIFNATNHEKEWLSCWGEGEKWVREKDPIAIKENTFGTETSLFNGQFDAICDGIFGDKKVAMIGGVRGEETPKRVLATTSSLCYKNVTWGKKLKSKCKGEHITFYPIYDWSYTDVWKFIFTNKLEYNKIYDFMYSRNVPIAKMRVSNLNHETALASLAYVQELEPDNWNKITERLAGVNTTKHCSIEDCIPTECPKMFSGWLEYINYLIDNIVLPEHREVYKNKFAKLNYQFDGTSVYEDLLKAEVRCVILNDRYFTTLENFLCRCENHAQLKNKQNIMKGEN